MAVSLTDFVQGCIMFIALILVPTVVIFDLGGITATINTVNAIDTNFFSLFTAVGSTESISLIAIISLMAWGLGYFGQPHIIVRFMALRSVKDMPTARRIGMSWMIIALIGALTTGLFGMAYANANNINVDDPETIFIVLSQLLFHPLIAGFLLAAILAAIMSTISSQLLVTSSSLVNDIYEVLFRKNAPQQELVLASRLAVLIVAIVAILLALGENKSILSLVSNAWAGFGAAFGPLILLSLYRQDISKIAALAGILSGTVTILIWMNIPYGDGQTLSAWMFELVPGFIISTVFILLFTRLYPNQAPEVAKHFSAMHQQLDETRS